MAGTLRIIAGRHRGRRLAAPADDSIRPTTDRVRENLFNIIGDLHDAVVVDGYAGTGALGCEALSRGARKVWFFDASAQGIELVRRNLATIGEEQAARVVQGRFVSAVDAVDEAVDLVLLDPPYGSDEPAAALAALGAAACVRAGTRVVLEQDRDDVVPDDAAFEKTDERLYGSTRLTFLERR